MRPIKVGVWVSDKKWEQMFESKQKSDLCEYVRVCKESDFQNISIVLSKFVHPPSDSVKSSPLLITPFSVQQVFQDRWDTIQKCPTLFPPTILLTPQEQCVSTLASVYIVKTRIACGSPESHQMMIVHANDEIKKKITNFFQNTSLIVQSFVSHGGSFFKAFVIGSQTFVYERSDAALGVGEFDSQKITSKFGTCVEQSEEIDKILNTCKTVFQTDLFGVDIVRETTSNKLFVIDVNYFPSFNEVPNFHAILDQYCLAKA